MRGTNVYVIGSAFIFTTQGGSTVADDNFVRGKHEHRRRFPIASGGVSFDIADMQRTRHKAEDKV